MKKFLLIATMVLSATAFAGEELMGELQELENEYANLSAQEEARFNEEQAEAMAASQALAQNEKIYSELTKRVERMNTQANTKFYKAQYEELAEKYTEALKKLDAEMKNQKEIIADFEKIQALRTGN